MGSSEFERDYARVARGFSLHEAGGVRYAGVPMIEQAGGTRHGFTQRYGGVSKSPFDSLNLGLKRPDDPEALEENYARLCRAAGLEREELAMAAYCHGDGVEIATCADRGKGFGRGEFPPCDGLVTAEKGVTLMTLHADCMPLFLYDPIRRACGMVHSGWKGASLRIGGKAVSLMAEKLECRPRDILVGIGPSICPDCFEVEEPVRSVFAGAFPQANAVMEGRREGKFQVDLWRVMVWQLLEQGIEPGHITLSGECTRHGPHYFSYRRDKTAVGNTGAMAGFMALI